MRSVLSEENAAARSEEGQRKFVEARGWSVSRLCFSALMISLIRQCYLTQQRAIELN